MQAETIFEKARQFASTEERQAYLDEACQSDPILRHRIEGMLIASDRADAFFDTESESAPTVSTPVTEGPGTCIGRYKLLQQIGEGGFGVVYMAEQQDPVIRKVALKIIKPGMDTKQVIARFEAERQALALLDHPCIAKVFGAGSTDTGRPYFCMELVNGVSITKYFEQERTEVTEKLMLFVRVCQAIQHAHQKGIIHRDIKPSNVMVALRDGDPVPIVIDFGIAKATQGALTDKTIYTQNGQFIGTPAYMSPEQADMSGLDIDTRLDIYSLGVLMYELLTGTTPFDTKELTALGIDEIRKIIRERDPVKPSTRMSETLSADHPRPSKPILQPISSDLDWIVMKCLEKDRTRRYETASGLAKDIQRHLEDEPVLARPPSTLYRFQKIWRRNKVIMTATLGIAASLIVGLIVSLVKTEEARIARGEAIESGRIAQVSADEATREARRAREAEVMATTLRQEAQRQTYVSDMNRTQQMLEFGDLGGALEMLNRHRPDSNRSDLRGWEWRYLWQQCGSDAQYVLDDGPVGTAKCLLSVSHDGRWLYSDSGPDFGKETFYDLKTRREMQPEWLDDDARFRLFSPTDPIAAIAEPHSDGEVFRFVHAQTGVVVSTLGVLKDARWWNFSGDGSCYVIVSEGQAEKDDTLALTVWNVSDGRTLSSFSIPNSFEKLFFSWPNVALSRSGHRVALRDNSLRKVLVYDTMSGQEIWNQQLGVDAIGCLSFSQDATSLFCVKSQYSSEVLILNAETGDFQGTLDGLESYVTEFRLMDEGRTLVASSADQSIRLWDLDSKKAKQELLGHRGEVRGIIPLPDGETLISGGFDGDLLVWNPRKSQVKTHYLAVPLDLGWIGNHDDRFHWNRDYWAFSADSESILYVDNEFRLIRLSGSQFDQFEVVCEFGSGFRNFVFSPSKTIGVSLDRAGDILRWDLTSRNPQGLWITKVPDAELISINPDEDLVLVNQRSMVGDTMLLIRFSSGETISRRELRSEELVYCVSSSGRWMITKQGERGLGRLFDLMKAETSPIPMGGPPAVVYTGAISPNESYAVITSEPHTARVFEIPTGKLQYDLPEHLNGAKSVGFSPDGRRIVTGSIGRDGLRIWDPEIRQSLLTLEAERLLWKVTQFSNDGNLIGSLDTIPRLHIWRAPSMKEIDELK